MKSIIRLALLLGLSNLTFAGESEIGKSQVHNTETSSDDSVEPLHAVHAKLNEFLTAKQIERISRMQNKGDLLAFAYSIRTDINIMFGLSSRSSVAKYFESKGITNKVEMESAILESYWLKKKGKLINIDAIAADYKAKRIENIWPDESMVDPVDKSPVMWNTSISGEGRPHRRIYLGESEMTGRLLAFENTVGVYVPGEDILKQLKEIEDGLLQSEREMRKNSLGPTVLTHDEN